MLEPGIRPTRFRLLGRERSLVRSFGTFLIDPAEGGQRLTHDLVHVVVAIGGEPADEGDVGGRSASAS